MVPLHRHQIVRLNESGWHSVMDRDWDATARDCLAHWAAQRLPLVVTRQVGLDPGCDDAIALGLPAPGRWGRRRLALVVRRVDVLDHGEFPLADELLGMLPTPVHTAWRGLCAGLKAVGVDARVYGSYGWQLLSGLDHVRAGSDIDLWLPVSVPTQADAVATCLHAAASDLPRLDGELMFADGMAVAWREWPAWRAGRVKSLLVKHLAGSFLLPAGVRPGALALPEAV